MTDPSRTVPLAGPSKEGERPAAAGEGFLVCDAENAAEQATWTRLWNASPTRDVFAHPKFVGLFCRPGDRALCAAWEGRQGKVLFPFILRDLCAEAYWVAELGGACDLVGPYGYGGPAFWDSPDRAGLARDFWNAFDAWAAGARIISEFVRFSPFEETLLPYPGVVCENRKMIVRELQSPPHVMWREFEHNVRYNVCKARRAGVQMKIDTLGATLPEFLRIYDHTMQRRGADRGFTFPPPFFERLQRDLQGRFVYFHAVAAGRVVASELVLLSGNAAYSFLGGTDSGAFHLSPNHLLKLEIIRWAAAQGKQWFVLGGGFQPNDGIFQYKRGFAPRGVISFHVGYKVRDEERCNRLVEAHHRYGERSGQAWLPRPDFFPLYRA